MRLVLVMFVVALVSSCQEPAAEAKAERLVPFRTDGSVLQVRATDGRGGDYALPYFPTPRAVEPARVLNIYLIPPPGRYLFDAEHRTFGYWNHYAEFPSPPAVYAYADATRKRHGAGPLVILALPGTYGSVAPPALQHSPAVIDLVGKAVDQLKSRYGATSVNIAGQSLTAAIAAALMARRDDLGCVVLSSGPYDLPRQIAAAGWPSTYTGAVHPFSAIEILDGLAFDQGRTIQIIADRQDRRVPFVYSERLFAMLKTGGHRVRLDLQTSADPDHHALGYYALDEMLDCAAATSA
jgi:hypothetical protein